MDQNETTLSEATEFEFQNIISKLTNLKSMIQTPDSSSIHKTEFHQEKENIKQNRSFRKEDPSVDEEAECFPTGWKNPVWKSRRGCIENKYSKAKRLLGGQITRGSQLSQAVLREKAKNRELIRRVRRYAMQATEQFHRIKAKYHEAKREALYLSEKEKQRALQGRIDLQRRFEECQRAQDEKTSRQLDFRETVSCCFNKTASSENFDSVSQDRSLQSSLQTESDTGSVSNETAVEMESSNLENPWQLAAIQDGCRVLQELIEVVRDGNFQATQSNQESELQTRTKSTCDQSCQTVFLEEVGSTKRLSTMGRVGKDVEVEDLTKNELMTTRIELQHHKALIEDLNETIARLDSELEQERNEVIKLCAVNLELQKETPQQSINRADSIANLSPNFPVDTSCDTWDLPSSVGSLDTGTTEI